MGSNKKANTAPSVQANPFSYDFSVMLLVIAGSVFFSLFSLYRLSVFDPQYDTVIFNQAFWNTLNHGELLTNSFEMGSHFGVHFSPILFSVLPFYYLFPVPETLFIIKSCLIALGVVPIYLCAREYLGPKAGCLVALIYFFSPVVQGAAYCDFYETSFIPLILGFALWGYLTKRENIMLACCCAALLIKEDVCLIIMMIGIIGLWMNRREPIRDNWRYLLLILISILVLLSFFLVIKPAFSTGNLEAANQFLNQYHDIPGNLADQNGKRIHYLIQMFGPLIFIPFAAPAVLAISIPSFMEILLSPNPDYFYVGQHYSALVFPVVFMALIFGLLRINRNRSLIMPVLAVSLLFSVVATLFWSPFVPPLGYAIEGKQIPTWEHSPVLHQVIDLIPSDIPVAAPMNILVYLTDRHDLYLKYNPQADLILLDTHLPEYADPFTAKTTDIASNYSVILQTDGITLYGKQGSEALIKELQMKANQSGLTG
jgi:uncharacterized membrane protein